LELDIQIRQSTLASLGPSSPLLFLLFLYTQFDIHTSQLSEFKMVIGMTNDGSSCSVYRKGMTSKHPKETSNTPQCASIDEIKLFISKAI
jgi:hypothetical protein